MMVKRITLSNDFHNTECRVMMPLDFDGSQSEAYQAIEAAADSGGEAAKARLRRVRKALCGHEGCTCGIVRGPGRQAAVKPDTTTGDLLRAERRRLGMVQVDLAASSGVAQATISKIERGHARPAFGTLRALRKAGIDINRLLA